MIKVFISHSSADRDLTGLLILLLSPNPPKDGLGDSP